MAAELDNVAPDANWLLPMIQTVKDNLGELPQRAVWPTPATAAKAT